MRRAHLWAPVPYILSATVHAWPCLVSMYMSMCMFLMFILIAHFHVCVDVHVDVVIHENIGTYSRNCTWKCTHLVHIHVIVNENVHIYVIGTCYVYVNANVDVYILHVHAACLCPHPCPCHIHAAWRICGQRTGVMGRRWWSMEHGAWNV
jgi:hypothetical protein